MLLKPTPYHILIHCVLALGIPLAGLRALSTPFNYIAAFLRFFPLWAFLGIAVAIYFSGLVVLTKTLPFASNRFDVNGSSVSKDEFRWQKILLLPLNPVFHIWTTISLGGIIMWLGTWSSQISRGKIDYLMASFFIGMLAGTLQAGIGLLVPTLLYWILKLTAWK